jgi:hypothetical protein
MEQLNSEHTIQSVVRELDEAEETMNSLVVRPYIE